MLLDGDDPILTGLRTQCQVVKRKPRELTGVGFFSYFEFSGPVSSRIGDASFSFGDVAAEIDRLQFGAGFVLHVRGGFMTFLEGYSFEEPWPGTVTAYKLSYVNGPARDYRALRAIPGWPRQS